MIYRLQSNIKQENNNKYINKIDKIYVYTKKNKYPRKVLHRIVRVEDETFPYTHTFSLLFVCKWKFSFKFIAVNTEVLFKKIFLFCIVCSSRNIICLKKNNTFSSFFLSFTGKSQSSLFTQVENFLLLTFLLSLISFLYVYENSIESTWLRDYNNNVKSLSISFLSHSIIITWIDVVARKFSTLMTPKNHTKMIFHFHPSMNFLHVLAEHGERKKREKNPN